MLYVTQPFHYRSQGLGRKTFWSKFHEIPSSSHHSYLAVSETESWEETTLTVATRPQTWLCWASGGFVPFSFWFLNVPNRSVDHDVGVCHLCGWLDICSPPPSSHPLGTLCSIQKVIVGNYWTKNATCNNPTDENYTATPLTNCYFCNDI